MLVTIMEIHALGCLFLFLFDSNLHLLQVSANCASKNATLSDFLQRKYSMSTRDECGMEYNWYRAESRDKQLKGQKNNDDEPLIEDHSTMKINDGPPTITETEIVLETATVFRDGRNVLEFYCDFSIAPTTSLFYTASYALVTGTSITNELYVSEPAQYQDKTYFRQRINMTETDLQKKIEQPLGIHMICFIQASYTVGSAKSKPVFSKAKFIGIECLNKQNLKLERNGSLLLQFRPTVPFGCKNGGSACELNIELYTETLTECRIPEPVLKMNTLTRGKTSCGLVISNDVTKTYNITIYSLPGEHRFKTRGMNVKYTLFLRTIDNYVNHPLFGGYQLDPISRIQSTRERYLHHVQVKTTACMKSVTAYCNCGVAVRAGRDLYVFDLCNQNTNIIKTGSFRLVLPSGTKVEIQLRYSKYLDIKIIPSAEDYRNTDGLCGSFDGDSTNDDSQSLIQGWSVERNPKHMSLFDSNNDERLTEWSKDMFLCKCPYEKLQFKTTVECFPEQQKTCYFDYNTRGTVRRCSSTKSRTKRDGTIHFKMVHDFYRSPKTAFVSKLERKTATPDVLSKRSAEILYTKETAYTDCMKVLNTTAFQMCSDIPGLNFTSFIKHCALDAVDSNSMDWTQSHLEGIKSKCVYEIKAEQPLPPEAYEGLTIEINGTTTAFENITENNITLPETETVPEFSEENLKAIENIVCLNECSNQGNCVNGTCECNEPFIGSDCSIDSSLSPEMLGIPDEGMCDYQQRPCNIIYIYADNIADTGFMCRLTPFEVTSSEVTYQHEKTIETPGIINGFSEVACDIADHRAKRSATMDFPNEIIAIGFRVGLSNNNNTYSEEDSVVHFDSDCVQCEKHAGNVACEELPGFCVSNGRCYEVNETHQCLKCSRNSDETHFWKPVCENNTATLKPDIETVPTSGDDTWVILAIVSSVIGVLILVVGAVVVKRCKRRQESVDIQSKNAKDGVNIPLCELK
ncbi:VWDE-like protein [Mya arenaria]|uniref:VWDE-like protein n=1 Tax=Mya arenaria TaxID=6604 RepID=A0ABY7EIT4_MYAAR|nr:VWDE-like protein [Mya arenaria]